MDPPKHCQSIEWSLHCSMLSFRLKGRGTPYVQNTVRTQIDLFNVQCCHSDSKADGPPPSQHCQNTELSLHCSMLSSRLIGRWTPPKTLSEHRVISSLFNVVIQTQRQMDPLCAKHCQSTEWSLHCSMFSFSLKGRGTPCVQNTVRTQIDLSNVQCCHSDSKADGPPPSQHCQSTEWSLHCSMLSFRLKGRWTPQSTLSEHRVISSLFNVVIQTHRQVDSPQNTVRAQSDLFTVQCCHSDSKAEDTLCAKHCQNTDWSLQCSMLSFRLKGRWTTPQSTLSEHRVISSLFNVVIQTHRQVDSPMCKTLSEHRLISSMFNVVIQTQRQMDHPPVQNTVRTQSDLFTVQCCHWAS